MTQRGWQFNLPVTDGGYHSNTHAPAFCCWLLFLPAKRDAAGARPTVHPSRLQRRLLSSSSLPVLWGEMLPLVYVTLSVPLSLVYLRSKLLLHCSPLFFSSPCCNIMEELLIYIFGHDASQLAVITPSACHWYTPPSSLLLNDFFRPFAFFLLSTSALHKSTRPLHPSKANDHHLFFLPMADTLLFPAHTLTHTGAGYMLLQSL